MIEVWHPPVQRYRQQNEAIDSQSESFFRLNTPHSPNNLQASSNFKQASTCLSFSDGVFRGDRVVLCIVHHFLCENHTSLVFHHEIVSLQPETVIGCSRNQMNHQYCFTVVVMGHFSNPLYCCCHLCIIKIGKIFENMHSPLGVVGV